MAAARLLVGENAVDDYFCEAEYGGRADRRGAALAVARSAIDPAHNTPRYEADWRSGLDSHPALRSMRSAMDHLRALATPAQAHRYRHDIASLYLGYDAEGDCITQHRTPTVWEYLVQRQFNSFRPCLTITDAVGGYELPAQDCSIEDAFQRAIEVHNDLVHLFEEQAAALSATHPRAARFMTGLSNWVGGNHEWHAGNVGTRYATSP
ncbi:hypothetical protein [Streptomyces sp. NPDC058644]|uniref:terpene synthase family protein n=1 Tax=unclassified Streptomyces TaxID=2593676 RepID=UPI0036530A16